MHVQQLAGSHRAGGIVDRALTVQRQAPIADHLPLAVVQVRHLKADVTSGQFAALVVQAGAADQRIAGALDTARLMIVQCPLGCQAQGALTDDRALLAVVQGGSYQLQVLLSAQATALVVEDTAGIDIQSATGRYQAGHVIQGGNIQGHPGEAGNLSARVTQPGQVGDQFTIAAHQPALAIEQLVGIQIQATAAQHSALVLVIQGARADVRALFRTQGAALIVQGLRRGHRQIAAGDQAVAIVIEGLRIDGEITAGIATVIGIDPGLDDAAVAQLPTGAEADAVAGRQVFLVVQVAAALHIQRATGVDRTLGIEAGNLDLDRAPRRSLDHAQVTVGVDLDIAAAGSEVTGEPYPHTRFSSHQLDRPGIHPAQGRRVDRQFRLGAAVVGAGGGVQCLGVDVVAPGDDAQVFRLDLGVDLGAAGDDFEAVDVVGVERRALDGHLPLIDLITAELAVFDHRLASGQGGFRGVDEAAAIAADAIGVGDDHMGRLPRHFGVTAQLAGAATVDFVEDGLRGDALEVRVADDDPAQLGALRAVGGVVEDQPLLADVVVVELVVRQAAAIGRGDIDDGHAVARLPQAGARRADHDAFRLGPQRLPEHGVGQDERQAALGHAPEVLAGFQGSRRLAGQESELANIHVEGLEKTRIRGGNPGGSRSALRARSGHPGVQGNGRRSRWSPGAGRGRTAPGSCSTDARAAHRCNGRHGSRPGRSPGCCRTRRTPGAASRGSPDGSSAGRCASNRRCRRTATDPCTRESTTARPGWCAAG